MIEVVYSFENKTLQILYDNGDKIIITGVRSAIYYRKILKREFPDK